VLSSESYRVQQPAQVFPRQIEAVFDALDKWEDVGFDPKSLFFAVCTAPPQGPVGRTAYAYKVSLLADTVQAVVLALFCNGRGGRSSLLSAPL
jgi:hypothetical protein